MGATLSTPFSNHLKGRSHNLCWLLRLDLRDGTVLGFTDHDEVLDFDLGDAAGSVSYRPDLGMQLSNVQTGTGLDAGNFEVTFPIAEAPRPVTRAAVAGGRFNRAETRLMRVVWSNLAAGSRNFMLGNTGEWRIEGDKAIAESRDQRDRLNQVIGRQLQNQCDADYADQVQCFATPTEIVGTVTAVASALEFTVSFVGTYANGLFDRGKVIGLTGGNASLVAPIWSWTAAGVIKLFMPLVEAPLVGDTFTVRDGCARTRAACMAHGQILNMRAFPEVPGTQALKPAIPAQGSSSGGGKGK
jgi:uncharacterized phage protein (TIGR02218 family)